MNKKKVYVTRMISSSALDLLNKYFYVDVNQEDGVMDKSKLLEAVEDIDALLCLINDGVDKEVIERAKKAKIIANYGVGYNNIDVEAATNRGIIVTNTPGVLTDATADLAWGLMFAVARRIVESDRFAREGKFKSWSPSLLLGMDITGKTLGIIGAGRIGKAFAKKSIGFDMKILYHNRRRDEQFEKELNARWVDKDTLLKNADFISINVPLTEETFHLIGESEFKIMKKTAVLVNTSRGPVVDEKALVKALREKEIWGAGLDVYENEPEMDKGLISLDNVVLLPHIGSATNETRNKMAMMAAENVVAVLNGHKPINPVNNVGL